MHSANHRRSGAITGAAQFLAPTVLLARGAGSSDRDGSGAGRTRISPMGRSGSLGMEWGAAPADFPPGARMAVLHGEPAKTGPFIAFLRFPDGYELAPHVHSNDEHLTVIVGTLEVGFGTERREATTVRLTAGNTLTTPAGRAHFAIARGTTIVQVNGVGPLDLTYVRPADVLSAGRR
jgi:quercetin dioxygenase-like cupin family protein